MRKHWIRRIDSSVNSMHLTNAGAPFIVGVPRSGTTLMRFILDAHPAIAIPPETNFLPRLSTLGPTPSWAAFADALVTSPRWADFGLPAAVFQRRLASLRPFSVAEGLRAFYSMYADNHGKTVWGDKTPQYYASLRAVQDLLPEARFIIMIRDGRDAWLSERKTWFGHARSLVEHATFWSRAVMASVAQARFVPHLCVRYEDLVANLKPTVAPVIAFLGLPYAEAVESYYGRVEDRQREVGDLRLPDGRVVSRAERLQANRLVGARPDPTRVGRWRVELSASETATYSSIAKDALQYFGYVP
jgi:hypothetical protein